ncbi:hypothetical protein [Cytobacillus purgationiresistens]|uniref:DUF4901 domain-containing protein n=1 Tax=Cytobacillus purgationiresistens TaxID=863449 RepID=A0ABU0AN46_9BACI|nr:hypothetical protein [Cytobacillus purgationiresistens]MDQ0272672.1 hypothetical protein [Cytobacillus purgationiresistens]
MYHTIIEQLKGYFKGIDPAALKAEQMEFEEEVFDILLEEWGESVGSVRFDEVGIAEFFIYTDEIDSLPRTASKFEMIMQAEGFIEKFYDEDFRKGLYLSAYIDLGEYHIIIYNRKDDQLDKELPNSGISFTMLPNGLISSVEREELGYEVQYPQKSITASMAKEIYLDQLQLTPVIAKYAKDTFLSGDNQYHYVYELEDYIIEVDTNGKIHTTEVLGFPQQVIEPLPALDSFTDIYTLAGLTEEHMKVAETKSRHGRLEVWSRLKKEELRVSDEDLVDTELEIPEVIKFLFHQDGRLLKLMGEEESLPGRTISYEEALHNAISLLSAIAVQPDITFKLQKSNLTKEVEEDDALRLFYFTFLRYERGVCIADATVTVEVDADTGLVKKADVDQEVLIDFSLICLEENLSILEAKKIIKEALLMELSWVKDSQHQIYTLSYLPSYPLTTGHIKMIHTKTGEPWVIDTSCMDQY